MNAKVITFFNNKGGVGKTSLVYHLAWMFAHLGKRVVAIDLDPQANLTSAFLAEEVLEDLWDREFDWLRPTADTIYQCIRPLTEVGDIREPDTKKINDRLYLVPGDLSLAGFEDALSQEWPNSLSSQSIFRPFRVLTSFWQVAQMAAEKHSADLILADVGPNLGAINRSALIGSDHVVIPLAADLFSLQGLRNLGPTLRRWRSDWNKRVDYWNENSQVKNEFRLPTGQMTPVGYVVQQHVERLSRPAKAYQRWAEKIPSIYRKSVLESADENVTLESDPYCLATIKHYRSLVPMAQEARKPIFQLTSADGAIGSHASAVAESHKHFQRLAERILGQISFAELF